MNIEIKDLNENQRQAVDWIKGPMLVLAGPGSGKTAVLTVRIANLIENSRDDSFRILGLTFTVKAANEMQSRIQNMIDDNNHRVQLRTFHSFCSDLLRQHGSHLGLQPDFSVITDDKDRVAILKELQDKNEIEISSPEDALKKIDIMFTRGINSKELSKHFNPDRQEQYESLKAIFDGYISELIEGNQLDFGSMLYFSRQLLETVPRVARQVKTVYKYICVDEFQDTNLAQYKILKLIAKPKSANLFVVADDDQIIFQWNGADPKRLEELKKDYEPHVVQLPENYRCPKEVVEIANKLIQYNSDRSESRILGISHNEMTGAVQIESFDTFEDEIQGLIEKVITIPNKKRESCLVIARSNKLLTQVKEMMKENGVIAEIVSKHQDFTSPLTQMLYFSLKLANTPSSRSILNKLCSAVTKLNGITMSAEDVYTKSSVEDLTTLRAFFILAAESNMLQPFAEIGEKELCDTLNFKSFIDQSFNYFNSLNMQVNDDDLYPDYEEDKENWSRISNLIRREYGDSFALHIFLQEMDLTPKSKALSRDCVRLQTVHTAKGMEFENVYIVGLAEEQFPTYFAIKNGEKSIQEERRNCFVAITRSSRNLYLSYAKKYFGWNKKPSRFLREMGLINEF